ncbi:hypothetical protein K402DRAFT_396245 [Aulographum hederae CBS 113979]|uniref:F-box domain-containing protein n=1 Tax=Aulographum hederae CBS 113979 TaxID=1176131 RepID=A0A6G1GSP8_9PEZI|nr:hypothetical protein K402DRAFT_396245 [Aulographum hederae CBS 113979]
MIDKVDIHSLPEELLSEIFMCVEKQYDLISCLRVCRKWNRIVDHHSLWKSITFTVPNFCYMCQSPKALERLCKAKQVSFRSVCNPGAQPIVYKPVTADQLRDFFEKCARLKAPDGSVWSLPTHTLRIALDSVVSSDEAGEITICEVFDDQRVDYEYSLLQEVFPNVKTFDVTGSKLGWFDLGFALRAFPLSMENLIVDGLGYDKKYS